MRDTCAGFGVQFDAWQDGAGRVILAKREDGKYACSIGGVVMSIPRQVGKTFLIGAIVFALCLLFPGTTVLWTAHRLRTANETFSKMQTFSRRKKVKPHVAKIVLGSGDEEIVFHNGSRILFGARARGFGRGFDNVDVEVFDEAQILTENAIDDMVPATNTAKNPLLLFVGTPPKPDDPSAVFTAKRDAALAGTDEDTAYIEFSADRGCDPDDREQWAKANPSYPGRTAASAMLRMKKNMTPESFVREGLGVWDAPALSRVWPAGVWETVVADGVPQPEHGLVFSVAVNVERSAAVIGWAAAGGTCGLVVDKHGAARRAGVGWVVGELKRFAGDARVAVSSQDGSLLLALEQAGLKVHPVSAAEQRAGCVWMYDAVVERKVVVQRHPDLAGAVASAVKKTSGDGFVWDRRAGDVSALVAVTDAAYLAQGVPTEAKPVFAY